jgi:hypothetical protein
MRFQTLGRGLLVMAMLVLVACHKKEEAPAAPGGATPEAAVEQSVALIKAGDFAGFWKQALPPADYNNLLADWKLQGAQARPASDADRAHFTLAMQQLTAPHAETTLYDQLKPKLMQLQAQYQDQLPIMIGIGQAIVTTGIAQSKTLTENQKQQARDALNVLLPWAQQTPWFDQDKAKQAVGVVVATAHQLDLKSPDQLQKMDFDPAMKQYAIAWGGIKQLLVIYGQARVKINYTLLGKPLNTDSQLVLVDGRWYSQDMINSVRAQHELLLHPATPATSGSAPESAAGTPTPASSASANGMAAKP